MRTVDAWSHINGIEWEFRADRDFVLGYIEAIEWAENLEGHEWDVGALDRAIADSVQFLEDESDAIEEYADIYSYHSAGIDFWLTRNGHGAGFWDRGDGYPFTSLTESARVWGGDYFYLHNSIITG